MLIAHALAAAGRIDAPGSHCWVLGTMRVMMFSTAIS